MKPWILVILSLLMLPSGAIGAEFFLRGRVIAIDRQKGEITVRPLPCRQCLPGGTDTRIIEPPPAGEGDGQTWRVSTDFIPPCVVPDAVVHIWSEAAPDNDNRLSATRITGAGWRHDEDSTGVRSRIRKRCLMQQEHHPPPGAE